MFTKHLGRLASRTAPRCSSSTVRRLPAMSATLPFSRTQNTDVHVVSSSTPSQPMMRSTRSFSTMGMMPRRGFPQYTIFGPESALSIRAVLPQFRRAGTDGVSVERRGKLVLEFVPRNTSGAGFAWSDKVIFSLSVEEVGLMLSQLPGNEVELSHSMNYNSAGSDSDEMSGVVQQSGDLVEKVLTVEPGVGATLNFKIDYMKDGIGGQSPPQFDQAIPATPLEVTVQAGEFEVLKSIFQTSIPYILGWNTTMDIASAFSITSAMSKGGGNHY